MACGMELVFPRWSCCLQLVHHSSSSFAYCVHNHFSMRPRSSRFVITLINIMLFSAGWAAICCSTIVDAVGQLIRREMADAGENLETIGRSDEIVRALRRHPSDGVVGVAPDVERRHLYRPERPADGAAGAVPGEGGLIAASRRSRQDAPIAAAGTPSAAALAQPGVVGQHFVGGIGLEKPRWCASAAPDRRRASAAHG